MNADSGVHEDAGGRADGWRRRGGAIAGLLLLGGAIAFIVAAGDRLGGAWRSLQDPDPVAVALLLAAVLANLGLTGVFFQLLYARHGRVAALEMQAVMAGATLLNYLPLRPGLAGRIAYHRAVNGIPVRASVGVMVRAMVISAALAVVVAGLAWLSPGGGAALAASLGGLALGLGIAAVAAPRWRPWPAVILVRLAEVGCIAVRAWAAFTLVGAPISAAAALALAAVAVIVTMVPLTSNGLGLREWATGLLGPALAGVPMEVAVAADLVARGVELLVAGAAGGVGLSWLGRRMRAAGADGGGGGVRADAGGGGGACTDGGVRADAGGGADGRADGAAGGRAERGAWAAADPRDAGPGGGGTG